MWLRVGLWLAWPWHTCGHQRIIIRDRFSPTLCTNPRECRLSHTLGPILNIPFKPIHSNPYYTELQISFEYCHLLNIPSLDQLQCRAEVHLREMGKQNKTKQQKFQIGFKSFPMRTWSLKSLGFVPLGVGWW